MLPRFEIDLAAVLGTTGLVLLVMAGAQLVPAGVAFFADGPGWPLLLAAGATAVVGGLLARLRGRARMLRRRESLAIVVLSWAAATAAGAMPYVATGAAGPLDAAFESLSGLTTTGASIFSDVDGLRTHLDGPARDHSPLALHVWRSLTHWIGGAGIVLIVFVLTPFLADTEALRRTQSKEASFLTARYRGSTRATVRSLLIVYVGLTLVQTAIMVLCGVSVLDAVLHSFGTVATGGFSTHTAGLATWGPRVQLVTVVFMVLGALNFAVLGRAFEELRQQHRATRQARGRAIAGAVAAASALPIFARSIWRNVETRAYVGLVLASSIVMMSLLISWGPQRYVGGDGYVQAVVDGAFNVAAVSTTTGFSQEDFTTWPWVAQAILFSLMLMGGCSGSTAGGLKVRRVLILLLFAWGEVRRCAHPRAVFPLRLGPEVVGDAQVREALGFVTTYLALLLLIAVALTATGADGITAAGTTASCFASTGPGLGAAGPASNYQVFSPTGKALCMAAMLLGRLEIYPVLLAITPSFWLRRTSTRRPTAD